MTSKTFCVLPWVHAATRTDGSVVLCCTASEASDVNLGDGTLSEYWRSDYVKDARRRMVAGEPVRACRICYAEEAHGRRSHRIVENEVWRATLGSDAVDGLVAATEPDGGLDAPLQYIDLRLGNTCNMQCVMCQPRESSRWLPVARRLSELCGDTDLKQNWGSKAGIDTNRFEWYRNPEVWSNLKTFLPHVRELTLAGGEPFLIKQQFDFVEACCEAGEADHIRLRYHTNGSVFPEEMVPYWRQFENVHFLISIDAVGEVADYVRHPSDWEAIDANVHSFDALVGNTLTQFNLTTHALNVYRLPEVLEWAESSGFHNRARFASVQNFVNINLVHSPQYQSVQVLPREYKRVVAEHIGRYLETRLEGQPVDRLRSTVDFMQAADRSERFPQLVEYATTLDRVRGTDVLATLPELESYWSR